MRRVASRTAWSSGCEDVGADSAILWICVSIYLSTCRSILCNAVLYVYIHTHIHIYSYISGPRYPYCYAGGAGSSEVVRFPGLLASAYQESLGVCRYLEQMELEGSWFRGHLIWRFRVVRRLAWVLSWVLGPRAICRGHEHLF